MDCSTHTRLPCPSPTQTQKFCQAHAHRGGDAIQPSHTLSLLFLLPSIFPTIRIFSNESVLCIGDLRIGVSASASVLPINIQDWFPLGWIGLILQSKGLSRVFLNSTVQKHQVFGTQLSLWSNSHIRT